MQTLFQIHPINLSVAVWVGFLALFGIATDDGVVIATYLDQSFYRRTITNAREAREATLAAGLRRPAPGSAVNTSPHKPYHRGHSLGAALRSGAPRRRRCWA